MYPLACEGLLVCWRIGLALATADRRADFAKLLKHGDGARFQVCWCIMCQHLFLPKVCFPAICSLALMAQAGGCGTVAPSPAKVSPATVATVANEGELNTIKLTAEAERLATVMTPARSARRRVTIWTAGRSSGACRCEVVPWSISPPARMSSDEPIVGNPAGTVDGTIGANGACTRRQGVPGTHHLAATDDDHAAARRDYGVGLRGDEPDAAVCPDVQAWRAASCAASYRVLPGAPYPTTDCDPTFGNVQILAVTTAP